MTITDTTPVALDMRGMTDDQIAALYAADDPEQSAAALREMERRDRAARMASARTALDGVRAAGDSAAFAQYLEADAWCRGNLLSKAGIKAGITDEQELWRMPADRARKYASEELNDFWQFVAPRITSGAYVRQQAAERRAAQAEARDASNGGNDDEQDIHRVQRLGRPAGLAADDTGSLRHVSPAEEAPQAGPGGPVHGGGSGDDHSEDGKRTGGDDGSGGPVQPGGGDMGLVRAGFDVVRLAEMAGRASQRQAAQPAPPPAPRPNPLIPVIYGPGRALPPHDSGDGGVQPGELKYVLDETSRFVEDHLHATRAQTDVIVLYAAATHALTAFPTFGRLLFTSEHEASGKTMAMVITAALSANPLDASGTSYALTSALAAAGNTPDQPAPTLYYDEISSVFGRSGLAASRNPIADILRKGYKAGATSQWSVNRVNEKFSIFTPFLMTGLRVAVPRDIRSRCICITMEPGTPRQYFDARTAEPEAQALAACLSQATGKRLADIAAFRARGIHPKLKDRKLEVWESLFAVAYVLGGQEWLNRCLAAFKELALAESDQVVLTPKQQTIKDAATIAAAGTRTVTLPDGTAFIGGLAIVDELRRLDNPIYQGRSDAGLALLVSDALPMNTVQLRVNGDRVRGYYTADIAAAWEKIRPQDIDDVEIPDEVNPFDLDDDLDDDDIDAGQHADDDVPAGQQDVTAGTDTRPFPVAHDDLDEWARTSLASHRGQWGGQLPWEATR